MNPLSKLFYYFSINSSCSENKIKGPLLNSLFKGAYWIIQRFLVHYQILHLSNIAIENLYKNLSKGI